MFDFLGLQRGNFVRLRDWVVARHAHGLDLPWPLTPAQVDTLDLLGAKQELPLRSVTIFPYCVMCVGAVWGV